MNMKQKTRCFCLTAILLLLMMTPAMADLQVDGNSTTETQQSINNQLTAVDLKTVAENTSELTAAEKITADLQLPVRSLKCSANNLWIDSCNNVGQPDERLIHLDFADSDEVSLVGWSADLLQGTPLSALYVQVGYQIFPCSYGEERGAVADYFQNEKLKNVGFRVSIPAAAFQDGTIDNLVFIEVAQDGTYRYEDSNYAIDYVATATPQLTETQNEESGFLKRGSGLLLGFVVVLVGVIAFSLYMMGGKKGESLLRFHQNNFLFSQLIKRDFTLKYKRTILGMFWSILSPLLNLLIMWLVFNKLLGSNIDHFVVYLFAGQLVFNYFNEATSMGMTSLLDNADIFSKVNVPKYLFLFSRNISSLINFGLTMIVFFVFVALEGIPFSFKFLLLVYPAICLIILNVGVGMILSAMYMFFRDMRYLWGVATQLIMWMSAVFYSIDSFSENARNLFLLNPVYLCIRYFRKIVLEDTIPSPQFHFLMAFFALAFFGIGCLIYKKKNQDFLYYI